MPEQSEVTKGRPGPDERAITRAVQQHYDGRNFDCMGEVVLEEVRQHTLLGEIESFFDVNGWQRIVDVGCGASVRNPIFAQRYWGHAAVAVDLSWGTLQRARERFTTPFVNASALELPFANEVFDFVISTGVIHHTPNPRKAFRELARITRSGGGLFLSVYNRRSIYHPIYRYLGGFLRALDRWGLRPLVRGVIIPLYAAVYVLTVWAAVRRIVPVPYRQAAADFEDKLMTPHAVFYTAADILAWAAAENTVCLRSGRHMLGMMLGFLLRK